jgi:hypothetical protein
MTSEKNKWIDAAAKVLELTQEHELEWIPQDPPAYLNLERDQKRVEVVYEARFKERRLRLYQLSYRVERPRFDPTSLTAKISSVFEPSSEPHYPFWTKKTVLELLDQSGFGAWAFPETSVLDDLLSAVRYQVAGVKDFLDEILAAAS